MYQLLNIFKSTEEDIIYFPLYDYIFTYTILNLCVCLGNNSHLICVSSNKTYKVLLFSFLIIFSLYAYKYLEKRTYILLHAISIQDVSDHGPPQPSIICIP